MSRPGYEKYLERFVDAEPNKINLEDYDSDVRKLIAVHAGRIRMKYDGVGYVSSIDIEFVEFGMKGRLESRYKEYVESRLDSVIESLKNTNVGALHKKKANNINDGNSLMKKLAKIYKYIVLDQREQILFAFSDLKAANAFLKAETYGDKLELKYYKTTGFTPKITDRSSMKDSEPNLIISALEKDFKDKVKSDSLLKAKYINFYSFFNLTRLNDRSPQFLSAFNETIETNKSTIKSLIQKLGVELFSIQPEYVTKAELNLFKFIQKELGFKFYSKHGRETYISNNADVIKRIQNDIHQYGEVTSTNVK